MTSAHPYASRPTRCQCHSLPRIHFLLRLARLSTLPFVSRGKVVGAAAAGERELAVEVTIPMQRQLGWAESYWIFPLARQGLRLAIVRDLSARCGFQVLIELYLQARAAVLGVTGGWSRMSRRDCSHHRLQVTVESADWVALLGELLVLALAGKCFIVTTY